MAQEFAIDFSILNKANDESVIYVTQDAEKNLLTFTFKYLGADPISLKGGTPVDEHDITPDGPTSIYFTISTVLSPAEFAAIHIEPPPGWQAKKFNAWVLTPISDISIANGDTVSFDLSNITANNNPGPGSLNVDYYNFPTINNSGIQLSLTLENLPSTHKNISDVLDISFVDGNVVFIDVDDSNDIPANTLILRLDNTSRQPIVPEGTPWTKTPVFYLVFVTAKSGPGYGALTTIDKLKDFSVSIYRDYGTKWKVQDRTHNDPPHWAIYPESPEILGVGAAAIVEFKIDNIVTDFAPSSTNLYLLSSNIPGYDDGSEVLAIEKKVPELAIKGFEPNPTFVDSGVKSLLTWKTFDASSCTLSPVNGGEVDVPAQEHKGYPVRPKRTTQYTLTARNDRTGGKVSQQKGVTVKDVSVTGPLAAKPATGYHYGDPVLLSWKTSSAESCTMSPPIGGSSSVPTHSSSTPIHPTKFDTYTLTANGQGGPVTSELNVIPIPNGWQEFTGSGHWDTWGRPVLLAPFDERMWFLAGGNEDAASSVFSSRDGVDWTVVTSKAAFSPRGNAAGCVFGPLMWLMGGQTRNDPPNNEIWSSADGRTWTPVVATKHWCPRKSFACLSMGGKMWVIGGQDSNGAPLNDVWSSSDGVNWKEVATAAVWPARSDFGATTYHGKLCIVAGRTADGLLADAWQSSDGVTWTGLDGNITWPPRSNPCVVVVGDNLYVIGGTGQNGRSMNDCNVYNAQETWHLGTGPGWKDLVDANSVTFVSAIWCAGGNIDGVSNRTVWGYGPPPG